jgi:phenylacetate-CoA ligase
MSFYTRILESVLLPLYDRARGREYLRRRRFLEQTQWWDAQRIREFQWHELKPLVAHVFASVPYYQKKYKAAGIDLGDLRSLDDFARLPPLTRQEIADHRIELCSTSYQGKLLPHATGGSSGQPTRFFRTYESYDWRTAAKDRVYEWSGWRLGQRSVYLWGAPIGSVPRIQAWKARSYEAIHRQLVFNTFSQSEELWERIYAAIWRFRPVLAVGYVSSLEQFATYLWSTGRALPPLRAVIAAAEPVFPAARRSIEAGFRAPLFNTYGSREFMSIAGECERHDGLHVNAENLIVETIGSPGLRDGEILVTDLHNYGMPFLRYAIGDLGALSHGACACGRGLPRLSAIEGRVLDMLRTGDGRKVPGEFFPHLLKDIPEFAQYRVEQRSVHRIVITAVLTSPVSLQSRTLLENEIGKVFGSATTWEIESVPHIPKLPSGKRRVTVGTAG